MKEDWNLQPTEQLLKKIIPFFLTKFYVQMNRDLFTMVWYNKNLNGPGKQGIKLCGELNN